jgi:hypothetical protein
LFTRSLRSRRRKTLLRREFFGGFINTRSALNDEYIISFGRNLRATLEADSRFVDVCDRNIIESEKEKRRWWRDLLFSWKYISSDLQSSRSLSVWKSQHRVNILDVPLEGFAFQFFSELLLLGDIAEVSTLSKLLGGVDVEAFVLVEPDLSQALEISVELVEFLADLIASKVM